MALVNCRECSREISDQAPACPHCGAPKAIASPPPLAPATTSTLPPPAKSSGCAIVILLVLGLLVVGTIINRAQRGSEDAERAAHAWRETGASGLYHFAEMEAASQRDQSAYQRAATAICGEAPICSVGFWPSSQAPSAFPLTDQQASIQLAQWEQNSKTGHRAWNWSCYANAADCASRAGAADNLSPAAREQRRVEQRAMLDDKAAPSVARALAAEWLQKEFPDTEDARHATDLLPDLRQQMAEDVTPVQWNYWSGTDEMSGKPVRYASVTSDNTFEFGFPYAGAQHARLVLRQHPKHGHDVMLVIEKGQILCHEFSGCPVSVRIDNKPAFRIEGREPADLSTETVFLPVWGKLTQALKAAKTVRVEFPVYQEGQQVATFNVKGFEPAKLQ